MEWSDGESFDGLGSDIEQVAKCTPTSGSLYNDYLLGSKILECCIMKKAHDNFKTMDNIHDLNLAYANEFSRLPSIDCLRRAADVVNNGYNLARPDPMANHSADPAILLGSTYRTDLEDHAKILLIIQNVDQGITQDRERAQTTTHTTFIERGGDQEGIPSKDRQQLPQYAMRLKEYAQLQEFRLSWDERTLSLDPPQFRAATRIDGYTFEGLASNKKTARHLAAKQACIALKIKVT